MKIQNQPATKLPWLNDGLNQVCKKGNALPIASVNNDSLHMRDCAYIVHACNAYPELVAYLKNPTDEQQQRLLMELGEE